MADEIVVAGKVNKIYRLLIEKKAGSNNYIEITNPITIRFNVVRRPFSGVSNMTLSIYNLGEEKRNEIYHDAWDVDNWRRIILEAGYESTGLSQIFNGRMMSAYPEQSGSDVLINITAYDGLLETSSSTSNETFEAGTSLNDIIVKLASNLTDIKLGAMDIPDKKLNRSLSVSGNTFNTINQLTEGNAIINNGQLDILNNNDVTDGIVSVITSESGLLGIPKRGDSSLSVDMIFEPRIIPTQLVYIKSHLMPIFDGTYRVNGITHSGIISDSTMSNATTTLDLYLGDKNITGGFKVVKTKQ